MAEREETITAAALTYAAAALFEEAYVGPPNPRNTWFVDNEPNAGIIGVLEKIDASTAGRPIAPPDPLSIASHVGHLRFALSLANRSARGEDPYPDANWAESWSARAEDDGQWDELLAALRGEYKAFRESLESGILWKDRELLTLALAQIAHGAWHLGAIRQALGRVAGPEG